MHKLSYKNVQYRHNFLLTSILALTLWIKKSNLSIYFKCIPYFNIPAFNGFVCIAFLIGRWLHPLGSMSGNRYAALYIVQNLDTLVGVLMFGFEDDLCSNSCFGSFMICLEQLGDDLLSVLHVYGVFTHLSSENEISSGSSGSRMLFGKVSI